MTESDLIEKLAELSHNQWAGWTDWMFEKWDQTHASGETFQQRWMRQVNSRYADLSEQEKESDRIEARKVLALIGPVLERIGALERQVADERARVERVEVERDRLRETLRQVGGVWLAINRSEPNPDAIAVRLKDVARAMCAEVDDALRGTPSEHAQGEMTR